MQLLFVILISNRICKLYVQMSQMLKEIIGRLDRGAKISNRLAHFSQYSEVLQIHTKMHCL